MIVKRNLQFVGEALFILFLQKNQYSLKSMLSTSKDPETFKNTNEEGTFLSPKNRASTIQEKTVHQVVITHRMSSNIYM